MNEKIPFKVSARTARLIGRENVATAKGAVIELVKNGYDADSPWVIILIDNYHSIYRDTLSFEEYNYLCRAGISKELLDSIYEKSSESFVESRFVDKDKRAELVHLLKSLATLYIVDQGEGMSRNIIENYWMTIGTDNKSTNYKTRNGRIKSGAKGIGRFALDKLGEQCEMITIYNPDVHVDLDREGNPSLYNGYKWIVNWKDFEGESKTIDSIEAELEGLSGVKYSEFIDEIFENISNVSKDVRANLLNRGTILKISKLRDIWDENAVVDLFNDLENLVPPSDHNEFQIKLYSTAFPDRFGNVESALCDDFDYKIEAHSNGEQIVTIKVYRNEYSIESIPHAFFNQEGMQRQHFHREDFQRGYWETTRTYSQLIPGFKELDILQSLDKIGTFNFTFYFLKRSALSNDIKRFYYREAPYNLRKDWLERFGGIKLFRDGFRIRPYGERNDSAFDWLGLGARKQKNPAGIGKKDGGYRVEVENVAGAIHISRLTNIAFEDKSSREGLQENNEFLIFKNLIQGIIAIFEEDRSYIARQFIAYDELISVNSSLAAHAEKLAKDILERQKEKSSANSNSGKTTEMSNEEILASLNEQKNIEIELLKEEQKVLRALASSGLMLASFSHDLSKLNISLNNRYDRIKNLFLDKIPEDVYVNEEPRKNPYALLDRAKKTDLKMQSWLNFATGIIKKDKRKRKQIILKSYFDNLRLTWLSIFEARGINLDLSQVEDIRIKAFEIDLDSIFYNLFSNSIEAFMHLKEERSRSVQIKFYTTDKNLICEYRDTGPGLSQDIVDPERIFEPLYTTKRNRSTGEEIGTGLGMWIVKLVAEDNDAICKLLFPSIGFGIQILFPIKYNTSINIE